MNFSFSRASLIYIAGILFFLAGLFFFYFGVRKCFVDRRRTPEVAIIDQVMPSVVNISTHQPLKKGVSAWAPVGDGEGLPLEEIIMNIDGDSAYLLGSGFIIDNSGLVLTNAHVIQRASEINITLSNGHLYKARLLADDYHNDIALLQILEPPKNLPEIRTAKVNDLLLGETVIAIGNPYGLDSSVTLGVLSATSRKFTYNGKVLFSDILQTDASIYPGNSGGPLINLNGEVIGMNILSFKKAPGIGFAIPLIRLENVVACWLIPERFLHLSLGIVPQVRVTEKGRSEVFIEKVFQDSPASEAGLMAGDVIEAFNGIICDSLPQLSKYFLQLKNGDLFLLKVAGRRKPVPLQLRPLRLSNGFQLAKDKLGLTFQTLTPQLARILDFPFHSGVILEEIPKSLHLPLKRGDLLVRLGNTMINSREDLVPALEKTNFGDIIDGEFISVSNNEDGQGKCTKYRIKLTVN